jgi:hypothetical protein
MNASSTKKSVGIYHHVVICSDKVKIGKKGFKPSDSVYLSSSHPVYRLA